jgi:hypothetical protein
MIQTDAVEIVVVLVSAALSVWTAAAAHREYRIWMDTASDMLLHLRPIALRRVRQQGFYLMMAQTFFLLWTICLFYPNSDVQSVIRSASVISALLQLAYISAVAQMEHRTVDDGTIDRVRAK